MARRLTETHRNILEAAVEFHLAGEWDFDKPRWLADRAAGNLAAKKPLTTAQREITLDCAHAVLMDEWPDGWPDHYDPETLRAAMAVLEGK